LDAVLDQIDQLVIKPVDGAGGQGIVIGPKADRDTLERTRAAVAADPRGWIAQRPVALSTSPTLAGDRMAPRHIDLRPFAVNDGTDVWVLPGGLTRVALQEGNLIVNSSQGGGSKDTWVLAEGPAELPQVLDFARTGGTLIGEDPNGGGTALDVVPRQLGPDAARGVVQEGAQQQ
jgi:uncharacterized circularly permuted ATP-grasp superfamily protein